MGFLNKEKHCGINGFAQLAAAFDCMPNGFLLVNPSGEVIYQNNTFMEIIFGNADTHIEKAEDFFTIVEKITIKHTDKLPLLRKDEDADFKLTIRFNDELKHLSIEKYAIQMDGQFIGTGFIIRNITYEEEILLLKTDLITIASHEFKTPITSLRGSVETLLREEANWDEEFKQDLLEGIHEDLVHLQELVTVWFDIKKIEVGTMSLNMHHFPIGQLIYSTIEQIPKDIRSEVTLDVNFECKKNHLIYGDRKRLQQVLLNLIMNGLVHNESVHKIISITASMDESYVYIKVKDNGIGIDKDHLDKIFERFYKINAPAYGKASGTGLGLSVCLGLMNEHKGDILVESAPGYGSSFTMKLPGDLNEVGE